VDAVTIPVPDLDSGLRFYRDALGHELLAVVADPFGNALVLLDLSRGRYAVDDERNVTGLTG